MLPPTVESFLKAWSAQGAQLERSVPWSQLILNANVVPPFLEPVVAVVRWQGQVLWAVDDVSVLSDTEALARVLLLKQWFPHVGAVVADGNQHARLAAWTGLGQQVQWWEGQAPVTQATAESCRVGLDRLRSQLEQMIEVPNSDRFEDELSPLVNSYHELEAQLGQGRSQSVSVALEQLQTQVSGVAERLLAAPAKMPESTPAPLFAPSAVTPIPSFPAALAEEFAANTDLAENLEMALSRQVDILERAEQSALKDAVADVLAEFRAELMECVAQYEKQNFDQALFQLSTLESRGAMIERIVLEQVAR